MNANVRMPLDARASAEVDEGQLEIVVCRTLPDIMQAMAVRTLVYVGEQACPYDEEYDGNCGLVTQYIPELMIKGLTDAVGIVVGPPIMMKCTISDLLAKGFKEENLWISQERKMCCGIGKCGHCKIDDTYICLDGPVFNYTKGKFLKD